MKLLTTLFFLIAMSAGTAVHAANAIDTDRTPTRIGIRPEANSAYLAVAEGLSLSCVANVVWINLGDSGGLGKAAYATVLAAKVLGKKLALLAYVTDAFGNCYLAQVEVAP